MADASQSQLLLWIKGQERAGVTDSSGVFTLDRRKAFARMGASALPFEYAWVLKVVQTAVSQASDLRVTQSRTESAFRWSAPPWSHAELELALLEEQPENRSLRHFADGIRALANLRLPFSLSYPTGEVALWTGEGFELSQAAERAGNELSLAVSHLKVGETNTLLSLEPGMAKARAVSIATALTRHAHWASTRVTLDNRVVSNIVNDPGFGASREVYPLYFLPVSPLSSLPSWVFHAKFSKQELLPPVTLTGKDSNLRQDIRAGGVPVSAVAMISGIIRVDGQGLAISIRSVLRQSELVWVTDGVEVLREKLEIPPLPTPLMVACSAEGLETDLSGMVPRDTEERRRRRDRVMREMTAAINSKMLDAETDPPMVVAATVTLGFGAFLTLCKPWLGLPLLVVGGKMMVNKPNKELEKFMDQGLLDLQRMLSEFWGSSRNES